jgi:hypothetical protein
MVRPLGQAGEVEHGRVDRQHDVAPTPPVAAVGSPAWRIGLPAERSGSSPPGAGANLDLDLVDEHASDYG